MGNTNPSRNRGSSRRRHPGRWSDTIRRAWHLTFSPKLTEEQLEILDRSRHNHPSQGGDR